MEEKYSYRVNGKLYFIWLTPEDRVYFERKYGVMLTKE